MIVTPPQLSRLRKFATAPDRKMSVSRGRVINVCRRLVAKGALRQIDHLVHAFGERYIFQLTDAGLDVVKSHEDT